MTVSLQADTDGDAIPDALDACPGTLLGRDVDQSGCSHESFCGAVAVVDSSGMRICKKTDWKNDEPVMRRRERDCRFDRGESGSEDDRCAPDIE